MLLAIVGVTAIWMLLSNTLLAPTSIKKGDGRGPGAEPAHHHHHVADDFLPRHAGLAAVGGVRALPSQVFDFFRHFLRLGSLSLLGSLITSLFGPLFELLGLPVMLAFIPSALIGMGLVFTVPLVLERGLSPVQAILVSLRLFARGWPSIVLLHGVMMALFFLALIPMGLGLIWVAPLYFNCKGSSIGICAGWRSK